MLVVENEQGKTRLAVEFVSPVELEKAAVAVAGAGERIDALYRTHQRQIYP